jgi:hypothetical protein
MCCAAGPVSTKLRGGRGDDVLFRGHGPMRASEGRERTDQQVVATEAVEHHRARIEGLRSQEHIVVRGTEDALEAGPLTQDPSPNVSCPNVTWKPRRRREGRLSGHLPRRRSGLETARIIDEEPVVTEAAPHVLEAVGGSPAKSGPSVCRERSTRRGRGPQVEMDRIEAPPGPRGRPGPAPCRRPVHGLGRSHQSANAADAEPTRALDGLRGAAILCLTNA